MAQPQFELAVPKAKYCILSFPEPTILLVRLNRPKDLNCVNMDGHAELDTIWSWMDAEPNLACGIITGTGRAFCAGADLKGNEASCEHEALHRCSVVLLVWKTNVEVMQNGTKLTNKAATGPTQLEASALCPDAAEESP